MKFQEKMAFFAMVLINAFYLFSGTKKIKSRSCHEWKNLSPRICGRAAICCKNPRQKWLEIKIRIIS
jgi:hypothetical protein